MLTLTASDPFVNSDDSDVPADVEPTVCFTAEDEAWWAGQNTEWDSADPEPDWDRLAGEAHAQAMLEIGCLL